MPSRKRAYDEVEQDPSTSVPSLLTKVRNSWELASICQFIYFFGKILKIGDDVTIELLETECLTPGASPKLLEIGLGLLKWVSWHRGLTPDLFDEYTRRQYVAKAPHRNPFGEDEEPKKFKEFDIFTKLRVLHQLTTWTLWNPDRLRERLAEKESEQTNWRIEPFGWDAEDRVYFLLDDNRFYRRTDPPPPPSTKTKPAPAAKPKPKPKPKPPPRPKGSRSSKRQKLLNGYVSETEEENTEEVPDEQSEQPHEEEEPEINEDNGLGGAKWEVVAITLTEFQEFMAGIRRSRDANERIMYKRLEHEVMPVIEKAAETADRRAKARQRELDNLARMATAKRSSRLQDKQDKRREAEVVAEEEKKKQAEREMVEREFEKQRRIENEREERIHTREQRLKEREVKRVMHEQELARIEENKELGENETVRISERQLKAEKEKQQMELDRLQEEEEEEEWYFDCSICGTHGKNLDDGTHSIACEKCGVWEHSRCHNIDEQDAERDDFHFLCKTCSKPKISSLKLKLSPSASKNQDASMNGHQDVTNQSNVATDAVPKPKETVDAASHTSLPIKSDALEYTKPAQNSQDVSSNTSPPLGNILQQSASAISPAAAASGQAGLASPSKSTAQSQPLTSTFVNGILNPIQPSDRNLNRAQGHHSFSGVQHAQNNWQLNGVKTAAASSQQQAPASPPSQTATPQQSFASTGFSQSTPHNPFLNDFTRQRPSSSHSNHSFASPGPSLTATQGNTDVRFSPSQLPGSPHSHSYAPQDRPAPSAYSPVKHDGPSSQQPVVSSFSQQLTSSSAPRELPPSSSLPLPPSAPPPQSPPQKNAQIQSLSPPLAGRNILSSSPPLQAAASSIYLPPAPTLSPSVNTGEQNLQPPVKRPTPENPISLAQGDIPGHHPSSES